MRKITLAFLLLSSAMAATFDVKQYGAKGDGIALDTGAIRNAVGAAARAGGGTVILPAGRYRSGTITLKSNVVLHLSPGAVLAGSTSAEDYNPRHLIYAVDAENAGIEGGGVIDGNGSAWWKDRGQRRPSPSPDRPSPLIEFVGCRRVRIHDITILAPAGWAIHPLDCDGVSIRGIHIVADPRGPNTDGIDIDSSRNVRIADSNIEVGDDAIVVKTTGRRGGPVKPVENLTVTNCVLTTTCNCFKIGTETRGDVRNVAVSNCTMYRKAGNFQPPISGIAVEMVDGAALENVAISNIVMRDVDTPIFVRLGNRGRGQDVPTPGTLRNVSISNVIATGGLIASSISGLPGRPVADISLSDINITMKGGQQQPGSLEVPEHAEKYPEARMWGQLPAYGLYVRHAEGVVLRNLQLRRAEEDARPAAVFDDVKGAVIHGLHAAPTPGGEPVVWLNGVANALISGCRVLGNAPLFLRVTGASTDDIRFESGAAQAGRVAIAPEVRRGVVHEGRL